MPEGSYTVTMKDQDISLALQQEDLSHRMMINPRYGCGYVCMIPLISGSSLVVMAFCPRDTINVFQRDIKHSGLGLTICLEGCVESFVDEDHTVIAEKEICLQRHQHLCHYGASTFAKGKYHRYITLHLSYDWLSERGRSLGLGKVNDHCWSGIANLGECHSSVLSCAEELYRSIDNDEINHHNISAQTLNLWSKQLEQMRPNCTEAITQAALTNPDDIARVHNAAKIIRDNLKSPPNLVALARAVGINDYKLKRGFKQLYQETVFSYLRNIRLNRAKELLALNQHSIQHIAEDVGYTSSSHFSAVFNKTYGLSPSAYRKRVFNVNKL